MQETHGRRRSKQGCAWQPIRALLALSALTILATSGAGAAPITPGPGAPRTPPSQAPPERIARDHLRDLGPSLGLSAADVADLAVSDRLQSRRSGATWVHLQQQVDGIDVLGAMASVTVDAEGRVRGVGDRMIRAAKARAGRMAAALDAKDALAAAAGALGLSVPATPAVVDEPGGPARRIVFAAPSLSRNDVPMRLELVPMPDDSLRLAWNVVIRTLDGHHWWSLHVDAQTGALLRRQDWIAHETYRVHALPEESPDDGPRTLVVDEADPIASPFGWHDTNGVAGAEFTDTRGNNVYAQEDIDADDAGGLRTQGGGALVFDFPLDLTGLQPGNQIDGSTTQLFYLNNRIHDILYAYGFDEVSGNFQQNNYGRGGSGGDPVFADTQDGSDTGNAQFGTPPDGFAPTMEMFLWPQSPSPRLVVSSPGAIAGTYLAGNAYFGGGTAGLAGDLVQALDPSDGAGAATTDACSPLTNAGAVVGRIAVVDRGSCNFTAKAQNVQAAGAIGFVVVNNSGNALVNMSGIEPSVTIPGVFLGQSDGAAIKAQLGVGVTATLVSVADRDSSFDAGVVVHEYGHGLTSRLTGGPGTVACLDADESGGMGEGWGDWLGLAFTAVPGDAATDARGIASYLIAAGPGGGIRNYPYSTDPFTSPLTYGDISSLNQPHGVGEVWAGALWNVYWNLVHVYGFDPDLVAGSGGNELALQLMVDGLKGQPCNPTMVEGRDAILIADAILTGGANACLIWDGFAARGIGLSANGFGPNNLNVTEAFDVPPSCVPEPGAALALIAGGGWLALLHRRRSRRAR